MMRIRRLHHSNHPEQLALDLNAVVDLTALSSEAAPWDRAAYDAFLDNPACGAIWIVELDAPPWEAAAELGQAGTPTGFACIRKVAANEAELLNLAVHPTFRRRGIGTGLVAHALQELAREGVRRIFLEVRESNTAAQRLYEKYGFTHVGRRRGYYVAEIGRTVEDALVLRCELPPRLLG